MYYFCEKYSRPITIQYYLADCVSWVPRLTLLDLTNVLSEWNFFACRGLAVLQYIAEEDERVWLHIPPGVKPWL